MGKYLVKEEIGQFHSDGKFTNNVRLISWYEAEPKIDIGKWSAINTNQEYRKSGTALSVKETNSLTELLVDKGFGDKDKLLESLNSREKNHIESINELMGEKNNELKEEINEDKEDEYYDPKEMLI